MPEFYRADLAHIHDTGFGHLAVNAAGVLVDELARAGLRAGRVVDLGCGSGVLARRVQDSGYAMLGIDLSESLVAIARQRVPEAEFRVGSVMSAELPSCVAVSAIGEVFNYLFDETNSRETLAELFARIHAALEPGGRLLFDMAGPARAGTDTPTRTFSEGPDWAVLMRTELDAPRQILTRHITTFRKSGELFRRDAETHRLRLVEPVEVVGALRAAGFHVQTQTAYGEQALPTGLHGFLATRL
ncbi:MAG: class I SAM-dependent methyltransferase [Candidatus Eisenbacteria bacterium]